MIEAIIYFVKDFGQILREEFRAREFECQENLIRPDLRIWYRAFNSCFVQNSLRLCLPQNVSVDPCFANSIFFEDNQVIRLSSFKQFNVQQTKRLFNDS